MFTPHHFALSVADLDATTTFYAAFGFQPHLTWKADDDSLQITHLALGDFILEIFCYATKADQAQPPLQVGNDLPTIGVKHLALQVENLHAAKQHLAQAGLDPGTPITHGRTGLDYFFICDPDGLWLEIVACPSPTP
jgi:catechol 2,3-dioxygenase-like lactoylglutathione lyase family enzyme